MKKRIMIGLMIDELVDDYAQSLCQGASIAAEEAGVDLVTMPVGGVGPGSAMNRNWQNRHYNTLLDFPCDQMLDVLIVSVGSIFFGHSTDFIKESLRHFGDLPIVSIAVELEGCSCVRFDNGSGIIGIVEHLICKHGYRRIAYVSGQATNFDSAERLSAFRSTMAKHSIPVDEALIAYGDFSESSRPAIEKLLDEHLDDMDAVCCANDCMAQIVCQELIRRGKQPGRDIAVTGYDNMRWSQTMTPSMATVSAEATDLGFQAIYEAIRLTEGHSPRTVATPTVPLPRESCGCSINDNAAFYSVATYNDVSEAVKVLSAGEEYVVFHDIATGVVARSWIKRIEGVIRRAVMEARRPEITCFSVNELMTEFRQALSSEVMDSDSVNMINDLLFSLRDVLLDIVSGDEKKIQVYNLIFSLQRVLTYISSTIHYSLLFDVRRGMAVTDSVRTIAETDIDETLKGILRQLSTMKVHSSWIYLTPKPLPVSSVLRPTIPSELALRAYHIGDNRHVVSLSDGYVAQNRLLNNRFIPDDQRRDMILVPLFSYREQYGLLLCALPHEYFSHVNSVARQTSSALETTHLLTQLNEQMDEMSLSYANMRNIASRDELTGCYNRRGFFEISEHIARLESNSGCRAVVAFADLDNLKQINDSYGHDEGDNAIILAARILQACFGPTSIIGRIGGDEFAVFDLVQNESIESIHKRLTETMERMDDSSGYPYHVSMSAGLTEFQCNNEVVLRGYVDRADRQQYINKKAKRTNVAKD